eukprot:COSAG01_NODE_1097_length_11708_cov_5.617743_8_plen_78_part_00
MIVNCGRLSGCRLCGRGRIHHDARPFRWCPALRVVKAHSSSGAERERLKKQTLADLRNFDVVVTTFEMVKSCAARLD